VVALQFAHGRESRKEREYEKRTLFSPPLFLNSVMEALPLHPLSPLLDFFTAAAETDCARKLAGRTEKSELQQQTQNEK
jgi:hypothetical protein